MSNLSVRSGGMVIFLITGSPDRVSALSSRATGARIRPVISDHQPEAAGLPVTVSCCLSATGVRFSVIRFPPRSWALLMVGLPANGRTSTGLPRSARMSCDRGGCPLYPGDDGAHPGRGPSPTRIRRISTTSPCTPTPTLHLTGLHITRHQRGFKQFTRPIFPSPAAARMERAAASAFPRASNPADQESDDARQGGDRSTEHGPGTTLYGISRTSNRACSLINVRHRRRNG
jgi:hypothetical protein